MEDIKGKYIRHLDKFEPNYDSYFGVRSGCLPF
jgi:hypothetical protein